MPHNVNFENLQQMHGEKAMDAFKEIADLGGFGTVGHGQGQISPDYRGGLDVAGVLSDANAAVSEKAKDRIAELAGVKRESEFKTTSSSGKMQKPKE